MKVILTGLLLLILMVLNFQHADAGGGGQILIDEKGHQVGSLAFDSLCYCNAGIYQGTLKGSKHNVLVSRSGERIEPPVQRVCLRTAHLFSREKSGRQRHARWLDYVGIKIWVKRDRRHSWEVSRSS